MRACGGKSICALLFLFFSQTKKKKKKKVAFAERERLLGETIPAGFPFSFVRSFSLSLSKKKERFKKSKKSGLVSSERGLTKQRDLIREERLVLPKARSISVSFSVLMIIIIANDLLTLTFKDVLQEQTSEHDRPHG